jgi:hypothetical protein
MSSWSVVRSSQAAMLRLMSERHAARRGGNAQVETVDGIDIMSKKKANRVKVRDTSPHSWHERW